VERSFFARRTKEKRREGERAKSSRRKGGKEKN
jgi:hypothetical protein